MGVVDIFWHPLPSLLELFCVCVDLEDCFERDSANRDARMPRRAKGQREIRADDADSISGSKGALQKEEAAR
jgi:hypothetical protein